MILADTSAWVEYDRATGSPVDLRLTGKGRALIAEMAPIAEAFEAEVLRRLGPDADAFRASVARLIDKT